MTLWEAADGVIRDAWSPALWVIGAGGLFGLRRRLARVLDHDQEEVTR
jgi:hypothetical protein